MNATKFRCVTEHKLQEKMTSNFRSLFKRAPNSPRDFARIRLGVLLGSGKAVIPLWGLNGGAKQLLTWEFDNESVKEYFLNPQNSRELFSNENELKAYVRDLISDAMQLWGDSSPFILQEHEGLTDFKIHIKTFDDCTAEGCVLASAFFPSEIKDEKRLDLYPILFKQTKEEQVETIIHELGHVMGLRHSFAQEEANWPNALFGHDNQLSIMNYGVLSKLTIIDKEDLKKLYQAVWNNTLKKIKNMPIKLYYTRQTPQPGLL